MVVSLGASCTYQLLECMSAEFNRTAPQKLSGACQQNCTTAVGSLLCHSEMESDQSSAWSASGHTFKAVQNLQYNANSAVLQAMHCMAVMSQSQIGTLHLKIGTEVGHMHQSAHPRPGADGMPCESMVVDRQGRVLLSHGLLSLRGLEPPGDFKNVTWPNGDSPRTALSLDFHH